MPNISANGGADYPEAATRPYYSGQKESAYRPANVVVLS